MNPHNGEIWFWLGWLFILGTSFLCYMLIKWENKNEIQKRNKNTRKDE